MSSAYVYLPIREIDEGRKLGADPYPAEVIRLITEERFYNIKGREGSFRLRLRAIEFPKEGPADFVGIDFTLSNGKSSNSEDTQFSFTFSKHRSADWNLKRLAKFIYLHGETAFSPPPALPDAASLVRAAVNAPELEGVPVLVWVVDASFVFGAVMIGFLAQLYVSGAAAGIALASSLLAALAAFPLIRLNHSASLEGTRFRVLSLIVVSVFSLFVLFLSLPKT